MTPMQIPLECIEECANSIISFSERKSSIRFENASRRKLQKVKVDSCVIKVGIRCDYLLIDYSGNTKEHFIELKGRNVKHAYEQIRETIIQISQDSHRLLKRCWIICTQVPLESTQIQRFKKQLRESHNAVLEIHRCTHTVDL